MCMEKHVLGNNYSYKWAKRVFATTSMSGKDIL